MQFSIFTTLALVAVAVAQPHGIYRRQDSQVPDNVASMSDAQGNVVPFNTDGVVQPMTASGQ